MLNKDFQEAIKEKWRKQDSEISSSFRKSVLMVRGGLTKKCYGLPDFLKEGQKYAILSKVCKKIKGLDYEALYYMTKEMKILGKVFPFSDEEYLHSIGKIRPIIINVKDCKVLLSYFGLSKKEIGEAVWSSLFSYEDYNKFCIKRHKREVEEKFKNDKYFDDININSIKYYNKEYVSKNKYRSDFLEQFVNENVKKATEGEMAMKDLLEKNGVSFEYQKPCLVSGKCYIMDFYLPDYGVCIEVDGGYHRTEQQISKDIKRTNALAITGILVVRFTNEEAIDRIRVRQFIDKVLAPK